MTNSATVPGFRRGVKFRYDTVRNTWVLLAPEKLLLPNDIATEILKLVDGKLSIAAIVDELAARFDAPREEIEGDVIETLEGLAGRGAVQL